MARYVKGGDRLRRQLRQWPEELTRELKAEFNFIGPDLEDALAANAPRDKGHLADAAHHVISSDGLALKAGYSQNKPGFKRMWKKGGFEALFQQFGTRHHKANPFVSRTWREKIGGYLDRIDAAVKRTINRASQL